MGEPKARELRGERVLVRPATEADLPALGRLLSHPKVAPWWLNETEGGLRETLADDDTTMFAVLVGEAIVGLVQYGEESDPAYRNAWIDIAIDAGWHGQGIGQETLRVLARHLIDDRGHHHLLIDPAAANERAIRCYRSVGFRPVGILRENERTPDGEWRDTLLMDLLARELG